MNLYSNNLGDTSIQQVLQKLLFLERLDIGENKLTVKTLEVLCNHPNIHNFRSLKATKNTMGDVGVQMLADLQKLPLLRHLDLSYNEITDVGARLLLESPTFAELHYLNLSSNPVSPSLKEALAERIPHTDFDFYPQFLPE